MINFLLPLCLSFIRQLDTLSNLKSEHDMLDPLQFAKRAKRGVEDATATLLNLIRMHLEGNINMLFIAFPSCLTAFSHAMAEMFWYTFEMDFQPTVFAYWFPNKNKHCSLRAYLPINAISALCLYQFHFFQIQTTFKENIWQELSLIMNMVNTEEMFPTASNLYGW